MIDLNKIRRKGRSTEYVGARIDFATKTWLEEFCKTSNISLSSLIASLLEDFKARTIAQETDKT